MIEFVRVGVTRFNLANVNMYYLDKDEAGESRLAIWFAGDSEALVKKGVLAEKLAEYLDKHVAVCPELEIYAEALEGNKETRIDS